MSKASDHYLGVAKDMIDADKGFDALCQGIDDMWHGILTFPKELTDKPDFREYIDLSPHDALKAGTTIMSTSLPRFRVQPMNSKTEELERAEKVEYAIDWHYKRMNQRGTGSLNWDIVHSALRYDAIAVWLDYLPYWFGNNKGRRAKEALRRGPFVGTAYNPRYAHVQNDALGLSKVLHAANSPAYKTVAFWKERGEKTPGLAKLVAKLEEEKDTGTMRFNQFDLMFWENDQIRRVVWGDLTESTAVETGAFEYVLQDEIVPLPFMPWIVRRGGTNLENESQYSVHPLLAPLYFTHSWKDQCIHESIMSSEIIKYGRAPRSISETRDGKSPDIDYVDGANIATELGETVQPWRPAPIDPNLKELVDRGRAKISSATLPRILQNPEFAGNTPFASMNAMMESAIGTLNTAKVLAEGATAEIAVKMLEWTKFTDEPLLAYRKSAKSSEKGEGDQVVVMPSDYNPEYLIINSTLSTEVPTDFMQRLNAAVLMSEKFPYPTSAALEDLGKENADVLFEQWTQEQYDKAMVMTDIQNMQMASQMQLQQQAMAAQQQQQGGYPSNSQGTPVMDGMEGQGYNPGGAPTGSPGVNPGGGFATGNPGAGLREGQTGTDVTGRPIA
jgi:hypothetical protein